MRVLHITAHLGGGVGRVLSRVVAESSQRHESIHHIIAILEKPENLEYVKHADKYGAKILICPDIDELTRQINYADIVQLEWWHHPALAKILGNDGLPAMRLIVWSHISGLYPPVIPPAFVKLAHRFLFSSPCSWEHPSLSLLDKHIKQKVCVVFSSGGFAGMPFLKRDFSRLISTGYVGTLNFAKLHPAILDYVEAVDISGFCLSLVGGTDAASRLIAESKRRGISDKINLKGYSANVAEELAKLDIFAYLLNPQHYGTTENALLEAMAMGVVPIVLDNPAERYLVINGETGLIIDSPKKFADAIRLLAEDVNERQRLSENASRHVRHKFSIQETVRCLLYQYQSVISLQKEVLNFRGVFGETPADWFLTCQGRNAWWFSGTTVADCKKEMLPYFLYEKTKSSIFHYRNYFPNDSRIAAWAERLQNIQ